VVATTVAAKEFLLVDDANRIRAKLHQEGGGAWLIFSAPAVDNFRGGLGIEADGSFHLVQKDEQGKPQLVLGQLGTRRGLIVIDGDTERIVVGVQPDFTGLGVWDQNHVERSVLGLFDRVQTVTLRNPDDIAALLGRGEKSSHGPFSAERSSAVTYPIPWRRR
jgi:hypothetical protein